MPHSKRPPRRSESASPRPFVTAADVDRAADSLLREGERPTIDKVRLKIGRGSPNTINPLLDAWWSRLAGRLDAGPAALHRLPEPVLHAAEGLWLTALDEARRRAQAESRNAKAVLDRGRQDLTVQTHVLLLRESELKTRLEASDRRIAALETELAALTTLLRKEQASRLAAERRLEEPSRIRTPRRGRAAKRPGAAGTAQRSALARKPSTQSPASTHRRRAKKAGVRTR